MPPELAQWITPGVVIAGFFFTWRTIRNLRGDLRQDVGESEARLREELTKMETRLESRISALETRVDSQIGELRERMARIEGTLDVIREFFVGNRRAADRSQPELLGSPRERAISLSREETRTHRQSYH